MKLLWTCPFSSLVVFNGLSQRVSFMYPWTESSSTTIDGPVGGELFAAKDLTDGMTAGLATVASNETLMSRLRGFPAHQGGMLLFVPANAANREVVLAGLRPFLGGKPQIRLSQISSAMLAPNKAMPPDSDFVHRVRQPGKRSLVILNVAGQGVDYVHVDPDTPPDPLPSADIRGTDVREIANNLDHSLRQLDERGVARLQDGAKMGNALFVLVPSDPVVRAGILRSVAAFLLERGIPELGAPGRANICSVGI